MKTHHPTTRRPSQAEWNHFLAIAADFRRAAAWASLEDLLPVAVEDPQGGRTAYCSVFEDRDYGVGLTVYLGRDGLEAYRGLLEMTAGADTNLAAGVPPTEQEADRYFLLFDGLHICLHSRGRPTMLNQHRLPTPPTESPARLDAVEVIRLARNGSPRDPNAAELDRAGDILSGLIATADDAAACGDSLLLPNPHLVWTVTPRIDPETKEMTWEGEWKEPEIPIMPDRFDERQKVVELNRSGPVGNGDAPMPLGEDRFPATPGELGQWVTAREEIAQSDETLLLLITHEPVRVSPRVGPPVLRRLLGVVSLLTSEFVGSVALEDPIGDPREVRSGLLEVVSGRGEIPSTICVDDDHLHDILVPFARIFEIVLINRPLPLEAGPELTACIAAHVARVADGEAEEGEYGVMMKGGPGGFPNRPPSEAFTRVMRRIEGFASEQFPATLYQEVIDLTAWLDFAEDPSPFERGRPEIWACAIAWYVASEHRLWYEAGNGNGSGAVPVPISFDDICAWFEVKKRTAEKKQERIRELVGCGVG